LTLVRLDCIPNEAVGNEIKILDTLAQQSK